jgi:hypothetical protein
LPVLDVLEVSIEIYAAGAGEVPGSKKPGEGFFGRGVRCQG